MKNVQKFITFFHNLFHFGLYSLYSFSMRFYSIIREAILFDFGDKSCHMLLNGSTRKYITRLFICLSKFIIFPYEPPEG